MDWLNKLDIAPLIREPRSIQIDNASIIIKRSPIGGNQTDQVPVTLQISLSHHLSSSLIEEIEKNSSNFTFDIATYRIRKIKNNNRETQSSFQRQMNNAITSFNRLINKSPKKTPPTTHLQNSPEWDL